MNKRSHLYSAVTASALLSLAYGLGCGHTTPRQKRKCRLPGCANLTQHNGGYCSAAHCNEHRAATKDKT